MIFSPLPARVVRAIRAAGVPVGGIETNGDKSLWRVAPAELQAAAQPIIDAFNPADPANDAADLDAQVLVEIDQERLTSSVVWVMLRQMFPADTIAQTRNKYINFARPQIIDAYKTQPWKP